MTENIPDFAPTIGEKKKDDDAWVRFVDNTIEQHPARTNKFVKMALCKRFVQGDQYKTIDETTQELVDVEVTRETRCIYNVIRPFTDLYVSKMFAGDPIPMAEQHEGNTETVDLDVVKVVDPLVGWWWSTELMSEKTESAARWGAITGVGLLKLFYDKNGGQWIEYDLEAGEKMGVKFKKDARGKPITKEKMGRFVVEIVSPHKEYFPDTIATKDKDRRYCIHRFAVAKSAAEDTFNKKRGHFQADDMADQQSDEDYATISGDNYESDDQTEGSDRVFVKELWWKPDKMYPSGKHIIVVGKEVVVNETNEDGNLDGGERLPIYAVKIKGHPDEYYGDGLVHQSITLQRDFNKAHSTIQENLDWTGFNKPLVHTNALVDKDGWTDNAIDYLEWSGEHRPEYLQAHPLPDYINNRPNQIFNTLQIIWGLPNVDMGAIPDRGSQTSGVVVEELKESSAMSHSAEIRNLKQFIRRIVFDFLQMVQEFWDVERIVKVVGENKRLEAEKFLEADLTPFSSDIDIKIGEGFGTSKAKRFQDIISLAQFPPDPSGDPVFSNQQIRDAIHNNANIQMMIEDTMLDEKKAKRNLDKILDDESELIFDTGVSDPMVEAQERAEAERKISQLMSKFDDHKIHIKVFTDYTKRPEWEELPQEKKWAIDHYIEVAFNNMMGVQGLQQPPQPGAELPPPAPGGESAPGTSYDQTQAEASTHQATGFPEGQGIPPAGNI